MKQSVFCQYYGITHDLREAGSAPVSRSLDHVHDLEVWFSTDDREVVECIVCGDQWGAVCQVEFKRGEMRRLMCDASGRVPVVHARGVLASC